MELYATKILDFFYLMPAVANPPNTANVTISIMDGTQASQTQEIATGIAADHRLAGSGHFNRASDIKSDLVWRNQTTGANEVWLMDKFTILSQVALPAVDSNWELVGIGDFKGDGHSDILWRKNTGHNVIWLMDGTTVIWSPNNNSIPANTRFVEIFKKTIWSNGRI